MCKVSDQIKFCTCAEGDLSQEKHTWSFHRHIERTRTIMVGITIPPFQPDKQTDLYNREVLIKRINDPSAFDVDLNPQEDDYLQLYFTHPENQRQFTYGYIFKNQRWVEHLISPFSIKVEHKKEASGNLENAMQKNK